MLGLRQLLLGRDRYPSSQHAPLQDYGRGAQRSLCSGPRRCQHDVGYALLLFIMPSESGRARLLRWGSGCVLHILSIRASLGMHATVHTSMQPAESSFVCGDHRSHCRTACAQRIGSTFGASALCSTLASPTSAHHTQRPQTHAHTTHTRHRTERPPRYRAEYTVQQRANSSHNAKITHSVHMRTPFRSQAAHTPHHIPHT